MDFSCPYLSTYPYLARALAVNARENRDFFQLWKVDMYVGYFLVLVTKSFITGTYVHKYIV